MRASAFLFVLLAFPGALTAQLSCGDATISDRSLHYCTGGRGSSVVVFESPLGAGVSAWDSVVTRVAAFARVITWDRAGTGNSPATTGPVENFTIAFDKGAKGCTLRMEWENTRASVDIGTM